MNLHTVTDPLRLEQDRLAVQRSKNARLRADIVDYLKALNHGGVLPGIALSNLCHDVQHPRVRQDGGCHCGKVQP